MSESFGPRYSVIVDGDVVCRRESSSLAMEAFTLVEKSGEFLELTLQNTRAISDMARLLTNQTKEINA